MWMWFCFALGQCRWLLVSHMIRTPGLWEKVVTHHSTLADPKPSWQFLTLCTTSGWAAVLCHIDVDSKNPQTIQDTLRRRGIWKKELYLIRSGWRDRRETRIDLLIRPWSVSFKMSCEANSSLSSRAGQSLLVFGANPPGSVQTWHCFRVKLVLTCI